MYRPGCSPFALHLDDSGDGTPPIRSLTLGPCIGELALGRGRGDRIDRYDIGQCIGDARSRFVSI